MRIAKFIAACGVCSRRDAEKLILERRVKVDGEVINSPALNVSIDNIIELNNKIIKLADKTRLWIYYKPVGLITTHKDPQGRVTVFDKLADKLPRVVSVGRLDINSEGLLLLTNSGDLAREYESPSSKIDRVYKVRVFGGGRSLDFKDKVIAIEGMKYRPKLIKLLSQKGSNSWYEVVLTEGKNREIRRIFEHFGFEVNRLIRLSYGKHKLGNLNPGELREVLL